MMGVAGCFLLQPCNAAGGESEIMKLTQKLTPIPFSGEYSSGKTRVQGCVTKQGNPRLRAALVELAWRLVRFQPNYKPVAKWRRTLCKGALATGAARKKAIVAVARQLAIDLWRIRTGRLDAQTLGLEI